VDLAVSQLWVYPSSPVRAYRSKKAILTEPDWSLMRLDGGGRQR
jgi:hypothetical protein